MATQRKIDAVKDLTDKLGKTKAVVLADYTGITHKQLEELRKTLKKTDSEITIIKNRLFKKALDQNKMSFEESNLSGSTAALFAYKDEVAPLKELVKFLKTVNLGKIKAGLLGKNALTVDDIQRFATLPSREILLANLVGSLQSPIYGLHNGLKWNLNKLAWALTSVKNNKN